MQVTLHKKNFEAYLPRSSCDANLRAKIDAMAEEHDTSAASIVRAIVEVFLSQNINDIEVNVIQETRGRHKKADRRGQKGKGKKGG